MSVEKENNREDMTNEQAEPRQEGEQAAESNADQAAQNGAQSNSNEAEQSTAETEDWKSKAEALAAQVADLQDQLVRAKAEMQNIRRRAEQDVEKAHKFSIEKFAKELLPVIDSLEKAIEAEQAAGNESTPLREGVELTLSMFLNGMKKFNLEQIDPVGKAFDPSLHEAMSMVPAQDAEPNTVVAAMQKGYTLNGRLVRPAMVVVAK